MATHILFESASGYAIFEVKQHEEIGAKTKEVQDSIQDLHKFGKMVQLKSFDAFKSAAHALENINDVSEGVLNDHLKALLELNLSKASKKSPVILGVSEKGLAGSIVSELGIPCDTSERSLELLRGVRLHAEKLLKGLQEGDIVKAQLGLGHSYSRAKIKFNVNRSDNMIIQAIALLDQLDKDVNTFSMRVREWYGWHFPELTKIVADNSQFAKAAKLIGPKNTLTEDKLEELTEILDNDETKAKNVIDAARTSMGTDLSELDAINILNFAQRVVDLAEYRKKLTAYLSEKMNMVAPSLTALIGERIGARLISHAGSLTNLSKYPASTVQILGAEKALFRALKTKGNTPKYGLIFHSSFIGRAGPKHKGRISRYLANKCSIASRIDCFSEHPTPKFGDALRNQVEERLTFFETGTAPSKNADAMKKVLDSLALEDDDVEMDDTLPKLKSSKEKKRKRKSEAVDTGETLADDRAAKKKSKEERKRLKEEKKSTKHATIEQEVVDTEEPPKKKPKKDKKDKEVEGTKKRRKSKTTTE